MDTIVFDSTVFGGAGDTITPGSELLITSELTIDGVTGSGGGATDVTVDGNNSTRMFSVTDGTSALIDVEIIGLELINGSSTYGGAIYNAENLTLTDVNTSGNTADYGGTVYNNSGLLSFEDDDLIGDTIGPDTATVEAGNLYIAGGNFSVSGSGTTFQCNTPGFCIFVGTGSVPGITITKEANPTDGTDFNYTSDLPVGPFTLDDANPDDSDGVVSSQLFNVPPDTSFTINEVLPTDWNVASIECIGTTNFTTDPDTAELSLTVGTDDDIECTFTNVEAAAGSIIIVKQAAPESAANFGFNASVSGPFNLTDDGTSANTEVLSGSTLETISEIGIPGGWQLDNIICDDPTSNSTVDLDLASATVVVDGGEVVICTFYNSQIPVSSNDDDDDSDDNDPDGDPPQEAFVQPAPTDVITAPLPTPTPELPSALPGTGSRPVHHVPLWVVLCAIIGLVGVGAALKISQHNI